MISQKGNDLRYVMPGYYTCITEYNEAETFTLYGTQKETKGRAEGEAIGEARGRAEEKINTLSLHDALPICSFF